MPASVVRGGNEDLVKIGAMAAERRMLLRQALPLKD
jgi:hypothetical protein